MPDNFDNLDSNGKLAVLYVTVKNMGDRFEQYHRDHKEAAEKRSVVIGEIQEEVDNKLPIKKFETFEIAFWKLDRRVFRHVIYWGLLIFISGAILLIASPILIKNM